MGGLRAWCVVVVGGWWVGGGWVGGGWYILHITKGSATERLFSTRQAAGTCQVFPPSCDGYQVEGSVRGGLGRVGLGVRLMSRQEGGRRERARASARGTRGKGRKFSLLPRPFSSQPTLGAFSFPIHPFQLPIRCSGATMSSTSSPARSQLRSPFPIPQIEVNS